METGFIGGRCKPFRVLMACGHEEIRMMREATAQLPWGPGAVLTGTRACAACEARRTELLKEQVGE